MHLRASWPESRQSGWTIALSRLSRLQCAPAIFHRLPQPSLRVAASLQPSPLRLVVAVPSQHAQVLEYPAHWRKLVVGLSHGHAIQPITCFLRRHRSLLVSGCTVLFKCHLGFVRPTFVWRQLENYSLAKCHSRSPRQVSLIKVLGSITERLISSAPPRTQIFLGNE